MRQVGSRPEDMGFLQSQDARAHPDFEDLAEEAPETIEAMGKLQDPRGCGQGRALGRLGEDSLATIVGRGGNVHREDDDMDKMRLEWPPEEAARLARCLRGGGALGEESMEWSSESPTLWSELCNANR